MKSNDFGPKNKKINFCHRWAQMKPRCRMDNQLKFQKKANEVRAARAIKSGQIKVNQTPMKLRYRIYDLRTDGAHHDYGNTNGLVRAVVLRIGAIHAPSVELRPPTHGYGATGGQSRRQFKGRTFNAQHAL